MEKDMEKFVDDIMSLLQSFTKRPSSGQRADLLKIAEATRMAEAEHLLLKHLDRLRSTNTSLFVKTLFQILSRLGLEKRPMFLNRYKLSTEENAYFLMEIADTKGQTIEKTLAEFGIKIPDIKKVQTGPTGPTGKELLVAAIKKIHQEKPTWKPSRFQRYVAAVIKRHFAKKPKPFTGQDVKVGAEWFFTQQKKLMNERPSIDRRARYRVRVPDVLWREIQKMRFGTPTPEFAEEYQRTVRAEARKIKKRQKEPTSTK